MEEMEEMDEYDPAPWWVQTQKRSNWLHELESQEPSKFFRNGLLAVFYLDDQNAGAGAKLNNGQPGIEYRQTNCIVEPSSHLEAENVLLNADGTLATTNLQTGNSVSDQSCWPSWSSVSIDDEDAEREKVLSAFGSLIVPTHTCTSDGPGHVKFPQYKLCPFCRNGFEEALSSMRVESPDIFHWSHYADYERLQASASKGCPLCQMFVTGYITLQDCSTDINDNNKMTFCYSRHTRSAIEGRVLISNLRYGPHEWRGRSYDVSAPQSNDARFHHRKIPLWPDLELGCEWVQTCIRDHTCGGSRTLELPTRLIALGGFAEPAKLIDTDMIDETQNCRYVALSHCLGTRQPHSVTTKENVSMDLDVLEQTFKDAITVTRALGHQYLWIDTLCIIQDDESDWQKECSRMDTVFSNALVTIAALDALDAFAGFLRPRELPEACEIACQVSLSGSDGLAENIFVSRRSRFDHSQNRLEQRHYPLGKRAWCLQEQLLSTRTLNFSKFHISFECRLHQCSDIPLQGLLTPLRKETGLLLAKYKYLPPPPTSAQTNAEEVILSNFHAAVEEYSARSISFRKDRLPGLSGLARRFYQCQQDDYLAGIWRRGLLRSLCWETVYRDHEKYRSGSQGYVAPSWSWASVNTKVQSSGIDASFRPAAELVAASTTLMGSDPFGQVSAGEITMRAWFNESRLHYEATSAGYFEYLRRSPEDPPIAGVTFDRYADKPNSSQQLDLACILLGTHENAGIGLVLHLVNSTSATYRRMGIIDSSVRSRTRTGLEDLIKEGEYKEIRLI